MKTTKSIILAGAIAAAFAAPAAAGDTVKLGMLDCNIADGMNFALASRSNLECTFKPTIDGLSVETYTGTIEKFGLDLGKTQNALIRWAVIAPTTKGFSEGALAGHYGGATASASFVIGLGANVLLGGWQNSIALQPVSLQSQEGINVALGVASLNLSAN